MHPLLLLLNSHTCQQTVTLCHVQGTANLVALARQRALRKFVLVTSIGADDLINPLNLFWGVLFWKKVRARLDRMFMAAACAFTVMWHVLAFPPRRVQCVEYTWDVAFKMVPRPPV